MPPPPQTTPTILILGAGPWGLSTALTLARRNHPSIKVLDSNPFPSAISAGNDLNKIAEESNPPSETDTDEAYFWNKVTQLAMHAWKNDPLLKEYYHDTGFIMAAAGQEAYESCVEYAEAERVKPVALDSKEDFWKTMPEGVLRGEFPGWRGFWKREGAGWVFASGAMNAMYTEAVRLGVQFVTGKEGKVEELLYNSAKDAVLGARTADGVEHIAEKTILAAGANSDALLDFKKQLRPTAWTLAHIPLSAEEAERYRNMPVLYGVDRGFFIEPDVQNHEMKICDEHPGYINPVDENDEFRSVPVARNQTPKEAEQRMRLLLSETLPQFADRNFSFARLCWDADTPDRIFLIDKHPEFKNLIVAVGGSGNGFMACPAIGVLVADLLEGKGEQRLMTSMRWRPETAVGRDCWSAQGRYGGEGKVMDLRDVREWTSVGEYSV